MDISTAQNQTQSPVKDLTSSIIKPRLILLALGIMFGWRVFSFLGHQFASLEPLLFILISIGALILTVRKRFYGILFLFTELIIGSQGRMLSIEFPGFSISIRLALFAIVMLGWLILDHPFKELWQRTKQSKVFQLYLLFITAVILGGINGALKYPFSNVFFDLNGYLFLGLTLPLIKFAEDESLLVHILNLIFAGAIFMGGEMLLYLYIFFHGFGWQTEWYKWLRDTRLAEITPMSKSADFYRIFFQSYIYSAIALVATVWLHAKKSISDRWHALITVASKIAIIASLSRSIWYGLFISIPFTLWHGSQRAKTHIKASYSLVLGLLGGLLAILLITNLPLPKPSNWYTFDFVTERLDVTGEAGASSRWKLLPPLISKIKEHPIVGSGFGTPVTFNSDDPRIKNELNPIGSTTTYSFEWGILDTLTEIGIIGLGIFLLLWGFAQREVWKRGSVFKLLVLINILILLIHITTPYLNHPLGLGMLSITIAAAIAKKSNLG